MSAPAGEAGGPLAGVRVLEVGHQIAGPFCARLLADYGADVVKVERPRVGDTSRGMAPFAGDDAHPEKSLTYLYLNYNKRGITLDLAKPQGKTLRPAIATCWWRTTSPG